jgi:8-oxo-dGTP pyrophosphatase MutT (NUDIX family)
VTAPQTVHRQVAALCTRKPGGKREVLLITSRDTGRWVLPKGWPMSDRSAADAALQEAWEEAGVREARIRPQPIGTYDYAKRLDDGGSIPVRVEVFLARVDKTARDFPEADQRKRRWVRPGEAAKMVDEPGLKALLRDL